MTSSEQPEFILISRLRDVGRNRQLRELPGLVLLSEVVSRLGLPLLQEFYRGDAHRFANAAEKAQDLHLFPILILLLALRLQPRALQQFLLGLVFFSIVACVWLSFSWSFG